MATVLNTTYPPIVDSYMPAFLYTESARIYFSISAFTSLDDIAFVHVAISNQKNNKNVLRGISQDGTESKPSILPVEIFEDSFNSSYGVCFDEERGQYYIDIPVEKISKEKCWTPDTLYKAQLRFQLKGATENISDFYSLKSSVCKIQNLSNFLTKNSNLFTE